MSSGGYDIVRATVRQFRKALYANESLKIRIDVENRRTMLRGRKLVLIIIHELLQEAKTSSQC